MSLAIDVDLVTSVNIAGTWYDVADASFSMDAYEYLWWPEGQDKNDDDPLVMHGGGQSGVCATGFVFKNTDGDLIYGPLTSIDAVRTRNQ